MDLKNNISSFEELLMVDPFTKRSQKQARVNCAAYSIE
jgi:hypothetical protein